MKGNNWLVFGLLGLGAYLVFKGKEIIPATGGFGSVAGAATEECLNPATYASAVLIPSTEGINGTYAYQPGLPGAIQGVDIPVAPSSAEWGLKQQLEAAGQLQPASTGLPVEEGGSGWGLLQQLGANR